jgi:mannose-6-phosphate isomerase-like protein (cupin superfamily)
MSVINLEKKLASFSDFWHPRVVGQFNGHDLIVGKAIGEFVWHKHEDSDDFFLVVKGKLTIKMRDKEVTLHPGEMYVVTKGVEHCPCAEVETHILLIEPSGTPNTGDVKTAALRQVI